MFDSRKKLAGRLADGVDLMIDFATLGEYGLEPVRKPVRQCELRQRRGGTCATGSWAAAVNRFAAQP